MEESMEATEHLRVSWDTSLLVQYPNSATSVWSVAMRGWDEYCDNLIDHL